MGATTADAQKRVDISQAQAAPDASSTNETEVFKVNIAQGDIDVAAQYANILGPDGFSREEEVAVRWRLDRRIMPILFFNVILASCDKTSTATGALYGMETDCDLTIGTRYSWVGSAFYFGYLVASLPAAWAMQRFPIAKVIVTCQLVWGILLLGSGFISSFPGMLTIRVLLGMLEAPIIPGGVLIMGMWYTRKDIALRLAFYYTGFAQLITGPIGYGVGFLTGQWFHPWRLFFWILGGITIVWALISGMLLPDSPVAAKFLSEREKAIVIERIRGDQTGVENKTWKSEQLKEALLDPKTWLLFFFNIFVAIPNGGLTNFTPLIVNGLGYSSQRAALLTMPTGIMETVAAFICNGFVFFMTRRYGNRYQVRGVAIIVGLIAGMIAAIFLYKLPLTALHQRLGALYVSFFYLGPYIVSLGFITINTSGYTKKVVVNAICFVANCVANIIGPQFFKSVQSPLYPLGTGAILGSYCLSIITICLYMAYCYTENKRRDNLEGANAAMETHHEDTDFRDLTDKQNVHFRYVW
ncbi:putative allantoate permease [Xylariales sp. PMI_506]|nr:putative allantoate permease [Xylariales sp. PMI_506]